jgi:sodium-dependent phosphate cotransporter
LAGGEAIGFASPVKTIIGPVVKSIIRFTEGFASDQAAIIVVVLALVLLFASLYVLVRKTKAMALGRAEVVIDRFIGRSGLAGMGVGAGITAVIQSSSVTTSLMVPLAGAGIVRLEKVFPVTLGANLGTTATALLASLAGDVRGLTIALVHLLFNIAGILIIYPAPTIRRIPIRLARRLADAAVRSRRNAVFFVIGLFYALPGLLILIDRWT